MGETSTVSSDFAFSAGSDEDIIPQNPVKVLRISIMSLIALMDNRIEPRYWMHALITFWRMIQFGGASLLLVYEDLWYNKSSVHSTLEALSFLIHGTSDSTVKYMAVPFLFVFSSLLLCYFILLIFSTNHYRKTAEISNLAINIISITQYTIMMILQPFVSFMCGCIISGLIMHNTYYSASISIAAVVFTLFFSFLFFFLFYKILSHSLLFRPGSASTITSYNQSLFYIGQNLICIVSGIGTRLPQVAQMIIIGIMFAVVVLMISISFSPISFVSYTHRQAFFTACAMQLLGYLVGIVYLSLNRKAGDIEFIVICAVSVIVFLIALVFTKHYLITKLQQLDSIPNIDSGVNNDSSFNALNLSQREIMKLMVVGFTYAHPLCLNWSIFKYAVEKWPKNVNIWMLYAKFSAIYPEESNRLLFISQSLLTNHLKGNSVSQLYVQSMKLLQARESNLSPAIKIKIKKLQQEIEIIKRKLRNVWDQVMQKNFQEIDGSILHAQAATEKTTAQFHHLLEDYPNNRFIAMQYSKYVLEILADRQLYEKWMENSNHLKRGQIINQDKGHFFGMQAFPLLPENTTINSAPPMSLDQTDIITDDYDPDILDRNDIFIKELISSVKFTELRISQILVILLFIIFYCGSLIILMVYCQMFISVRAEIVSKINHASYIRSLQFQLSVLTHHYIMETIPYGAPLFSEVDAPKLKFIGFGGEKTTKGEIKFIVQQAMKELNDLGAFKGMKINNPYYIIANDYLYGTMVPFKQFKNPEDVTIINRTMNFAIMDMSMHAIQLIETDYLYHDILNETIVLNVIQNSQNVADAISAGLEANIYYVFVQYNDSMKQSIIVFCSLSVVYAIIYLLCEVNLYKSIQKARIDSYTCLTSLPKNVVVKMCDGLLSMKKNSSGDSLNTFESEELSRQDENVIKIFSNVGTSDMKEQNSVISIGSSVLVFIFYIISIAFAALMFQSIGFSFVQNAPQLSNILGSYGYLIGTMLGINNWACSINGFKSGNLNTDIMYDRAISRMLIYIDYFNHARYGGQESDSPPYPNFNQELDRISSRAKCSFSTIPSTLRDVDDCLATSINMRLIQPLVVRFAADYDDGASQTVDTHSYIINELWYLTAYKLYEEFFYPMFARIEPTILSTAQAVKDSYIIAISIFFVLSIIARGVTLYIVQVNIQKMRFSLNLLCYAKPENIFLNNKIMDFLSGNNSKTKKESNILTVDFFDEVVASLPDSIIISDAEYKIIKINKSTEKLFMTTEEELKGIDVRELMSQRYFSVPPPKTIFNSMEEFNGQIKREDDSIIYLKIVGSFSGTAYVLSIRDETPIVIYNNLIAEERDRSDHLLETILPPALVRRVQAGERNICFTVQSASICFIDIVEFTPWCASNTASQVMKTLNSLFKSFDQLVAKYPTLSRIKCIGDCYMMAGGIFSDVNQPAVHAKESVEFGIEAIQSLETLNSALGNTLRIRVGINTGGPIVAGVIGSGKPTFEILGPAINMAQQMEHNGVPMNVHISRSVYELIFGGPFVIRERGMIEIKGGAVLTYLVSGKQKTK